MLSEYRNTRTAPWIDREDHAHECDRVEELTAVIESVADELRTEATEWPLCKDLAAQLNAWADALEDA